MIFFAGYVNASHTRVHVFINLRLCNMAILLHGYLLFRIRKARACEGRESFVQRISNFLASDPDANQSLEEITFSINTRAYFAPYPVSGQLFAGYKADPSAWTLIIRPYLV